MKDIKIDLNDPFDLTLAAVLTLPDANLPVADALRSLYAAAHGRTVQTSIGPIAIVPATDPSLKQGPLSISSRRGLVDLALRRAAPRTVLSKEATDRQSRSALGDFISGRLGSPECWPTPLHGQPSVRLGSNEMQRTFSRKMSVRLGLNEV